MNQVSHEENLESTVRNSLGSFTPLSISEIDTVANAEKYAKSDNDVSQDGQYLEDIFGYMSELNKMVADGNAICADNSGKDSLYDSLLRTADYISQQSDGASVRYIEIGPEPHKTKLILKRLTENRVNLTSYVGLDINPESEKHMRMVLEPVIGKHRFSYMVNDYNKLDYSCFGFHDGITIMTMMGFQEGNEMPLKMLNILENLTRKGDFLLSEMQLSSFSGWKPIIDFYSLQHMQSFSQKICERIEIKATGQHKIFLTPIDTELGPIMTAATIVPYQSGEGARYLLTNCCFKYTREQFRAVRQYKNTFKVVKEFLSGDQTVSYQLALRN